MRQSVRGFSFILRTFIANSLQSTSPMSIEKNLRHFDKWCGFVVEQFEYVFFSKIIKQLEFNIFDSFSLTCLLTNDSKLPCCDIRPVRRDVTFDNLILHSYLDRSTNTKSMCYIGSSKSEAFSCIYEFFEQFKI